VRWLFERQAARRARHAPRPVEPIGVVEPRLERTPRRQSLHEAIIDRLIAATPGAKRFRFKQSILDAVAGKHGDHTPIAAEGSDDPTETYVDCHRCLMNEEAGDLPRPDAFTIDAARMEVTAYEVEVTHRVDHDRVSQYADLWWLLDEDYWMLRLVVVDRFENHTEIDVFESDIVMRIGSEVPPERFVEVRAHMGIRTPGEIWSENPEPVKP
jgi:hypothetical protein